MIGTELVWGRSRIESALAFNPEQVRMFSFSERMILLTIGNKPERFEFGSHEEMQAAIREWLERAVPED